jgi:hypothetical protein
VADNYSIVEQRPESAPFEENGMSITAVGINAEDLVVADGTRRAMPGEKVAPRNAAAARGRMLGLSGPQQPKSRSNETIRATRTQLKFKELEHGGTEKVGQLFLDMLHAFP